jgi:hypothetical protein
LIKTANGRDLEAIVTLMELAAHVKKEACLSQGGVFTQNGQCVIFPASLGVRVL